MENLKGVFGSENECVYIVEDGDTLRSIAENFSTTEHLIIEDNFLKNQIKTGDKLYIKTYQKIYIVTPYDTLNGIALKFGVTTQSLLETNKILYIYAGERIVIP